MIAVFEGWAETSTLFIIQAEVDSVRCLALS